MFSGKIENENILEFYADAILSELSRKWQLYRGLIDTPCNLVVLRDNHFLFLSSTALDYNEHKVLLSSSNWGLKSSYPIDRIERAVKGYLATLS